MSQPLHRGWIPSSNLLLNLKCKENNTFFLVLKPMTQYIHDSTRVPHLNQMTRWQKCRLVVLHVYQESLAMDNDQEVHALANNYLFNKSQKGLHNVWYQSKVTQMQTLTTNWKIQNLDQCEQLRPTIRSNRSNTKDLCWMFLPANNSSVMFSTSTILALFLFLAYKQKQTLRAERTVCPDV